MAQIARHREALVRTAMRLFRRQGFAATGLQQILDESGAPKGSLYHYFPGGKEELGEAAVALAGDLIAGMLSGHAAHHPDDPAAFVAAYCRTVADWMAEAEFRSGCPIATCMLETAPQSALMTRVGNEVIDRWVEIVAGVLRSSAPSPRAARRQATAVIAAVEGALLLARIRQSVDPILDVARILYPRP
jgi:TetR/AcrR family transcriptional repressor of lmrAB and yxaGH operons